MLEHVCSIVAAARVRISIMLRQIDGVGAVLPSAVVVGHAGVHGAQF